MSLNPLANPKGVKLCCELCSKPAFVACTKCRVTYYCGTEHQNIDWVGIHEKICQLLIPLRAEIPFTSGSEEEREHWKQQRVTRQKQMIDLTHTAGQKLLFEAKYEYAIPAAMQSLKFSIDVYGLNSIELVPSYLILGEACIGLNRLAQAEEYLSQAQWTVVKTPECTDDMKSRLFRNLGMLYASKEQFDEALRCLADDIYYASCAFGTDDIKTSGGYFHMANVFYQQNKFDAAFSLYTQLTSIWHDHLEHLVHQRVTIPKVCSGIGPAQDVTTVEDDFEQLHEAEGAEAMQILHAILQLRENQKSSNPAISTKLYYTIALLYTILNNYNQAYFYSEKALSALKKGVTMDHKEQQKIENFQASIKILSELDGVTLTQN